MKILVTLQYEYDVDPANYPEGHTPTEMANLDLEGDVIVTLGESKFLTVAAEEVRRDES